MFRLRRTQCVCCACDALSVYRYLYTKNCAAYSNDIGGMGSFCLLLARVVYYRLRCIELFTCICYWYTIILLLLVEEKSILPESYLFLTGAHHIWPIKTMSGSEVLLLKQQELTTPQTAAATTTTIMKKIKPQD